LMGMPRDPDPVPGKAGNDWEPSFARCPISLPKDEPSKG
jgi:hypothetical protein